MKAIHKLHDQRVLSDKSRLLAAASSRLPSTNVNANEKFQALVETCVVRNSQGKLPGDCANGSPSKEDDSKLDQHSSYSTTSGDSAETHQDSRSSQEVKETGIDVERPHHTPRKPFSSSPDLNLNLDSNDSYITKCESPLTTHMAGLHEVNAPPKTVSVLGVEVQTSSSDPASRPPFPLHFYGPGSDEQRPSDQAVEYSRRLPLLFSTTTSHQDSGKDSCTTPGLTRRLDPDKELQ